MTDDEEYPPRPNIETEVKALTEAPGFTDYARVRRVEVFPNQATVELLMLREDRKFIGPDGGIAVEIHNMKVRT